MKQLQQSWFTLSCLQLSGALSLPMIMVGYYLGRHNSPQTALLQISLGNLGLFSLALLYMRIINLKKQTTIELAQGLFGSSGTYICAAGLVLSLLGWSAIQINLLAASTQRPYFTALLITLLIYFLTRGDLAFLARVNKIIFPLLGASLAYLLITLPQASSGLSIVEKVTFQAGFMMIVTAGSGLVFDLPTFYRHAATPRDACLSLALIYLLALPLIEALGIYLATRYVSQANWVNGFINSFSLPTLFFLMLSGLSGACLNLYSAAVTLNRVLSFPYKKTLASLCLFVFLFSFVNLERHFSTFLEVINLNAEIITVLILIYTGFKGVQMTEPTAQQRIIHQAILLFVLSYAACTKFFQLSVFNDLFLDTAFLSCMLMAVYCLSSSAKVYYAGDR